MNHLVIFALVVLSGIPTVYFILKAIYKKSMLISVSMTIVVAYAFLLFLAYLIGTMGIKHLYWGFPVAMIFLGLAFYYNNLIVRKPMQKIIDIVRELGEGNLNQTIDNELTSKNNEIGDLRELEIINKKQIQDLLNIQKYYSNDKRTESRKAGEIYNFYNEIKDGDIILAQKGHNILGIGIITDEYLYNESAPFAHQRIVEWIIKNPKFLCKYL